MNSETVKTQTVIDNGHEFLRRALSAQCDIDGIDRPELFSVDKTKTLDKIALDANEVATYLSALKQLIPMQSELTDIGRKLEKEGKIDCDIGDSYAELALQYIKSNL